MKKIYESHYIKQLFDDMSSTYELMNYITSFGFSELWRWQCIQRLRLSTPSVVADLMTGMGESWHHLLPKIGKNGHLIALDFSEGMLRYAHKRKQKKPYAAHQITIKNEDLFANSIPDSSLDAVVSTYGLKTFNEEQIKKLAVELKRILKNGGQFSLVEVSTPPFFLLRVVYLFYLRYIIPLLGKLFLGNPSTYRMLGLYTIAFGNCNAVHQYFEAMGLPCQTYSLFFGCATGVYGVVEKE